MQNARERHGCVIVRPGLRAAAIVSVMGSVKRCPWGYAGRRGFVRRRSLRFTMACRDTERKVVDVREPERPPWRCVRSTAWARCADGGGRARGDARGTRRAARGRRRAAGGARLRRQGDREGGRPERSPLGHAGPAGREDRQRCAGRDARLGRVGTGAGRHAAGRDHDGRPAGLGQDDHHRQDRASGWRSASARRC